MLRLILTLAAIVGIFVLVAMTVAPSQPGLRSWYLANACDHLDKLSTDICAAIRRAGNERAN